MCIGGQGFRYSNIVFMFLNAAVVSTDSAKTNALHANKTLVKMSFFIATLFNKLKIQVDVVKSAYWLLLVQSRGNL